jgi:hypothetical protein
MTHCGLSEENSFENGGNQDIRNDGLLAKPMMVSNHRE